MSSPLQIPSKKPSELPYSVTPLYAFGKSPPKRSSYSSSPNFSNFSPQKSLLQPDSPQKNPSPSLLAPTPLNPTPKPSDSSLLSLDKNQVGNVASSVIKNRVGAVLSRGMVLKADHFIHNSSENLQIHLQGAPNFRQVPDFNIYGSAQPDTSGINTILTLLECGPQRRPSLTENTPPTRICHWFSAREEPLCYINGIPFVLRDASTPKRNLSYRGITAERLESLEERLKEDVQREAKRWGGLILVHDEQGDQVIPTWIAASSVQTPRQVFDTFSSSGHRIKYYRAPISPEQGPEDVYLDQYVSVLSKANPTDPLVFNCGVGIGRTTFAIIVAMLIRRVQLISQGLPDPFPVYESLDISGQLDPFLRPVSPSILPPKKSLSAPPTMAIASELQNMHEQQVQNRALLRSVQVLEKGLGQKSVIEWVLARGNLIDDLKNAILGNYQIVLQLVSVLQQGPMTKRLLDEMIDRNDVLINLREVILEHRIRYSVKGDAGDLDKALGTLERYFFLLAFAGYIEEASPLFSQKFSEWIKSRSEIWSMISSLRKRGTSRLHMFRPVHDLSMLSQPGGVYSQASLPVGMELEGFVVKNRQGSVLTSQTILKVDFWGGGKLPQQVHEASNFRRIPGVWVFGVAQPTIKGMKTVVETIQSMPEAPSKLIWICLREEPIVMVNSVPYVLRDQYFTLRNLKSFMGITPARLEMMEERLKADVLSELDQYDGRLLLHQELEPGNIAPMWESVLSQDVLTLKQVVNQLQQEGVDMDYYRIPVTAEHAPQEEDFDFLMRVLSRVDWTDTAVVLNCQIGSGRSTTGTVVAYLIFHWANGTRPPGEGVDRSYSVIHSLLRTLRNGLEAKRAVDNAIDICAQTINLRDSIESWRVSAESEKDPSQRKRLIRRAQLHLERYFMLICFQAYLDAHPPDAFDFPTFSDWVKDHQEFATMRMEIEHADLTSLTPVDKMNPGDGIALSSEVLEVLKGRRGAVLAPQTILKADIFPNCQKLALLERVDGAPNYRRIALLQVREQAPQVAQGVSFPPSSIVEKSIKADAVNSGSPMAARRASIVSQNNLPAFDKLSINMTMSVGNLPTPSTMTAWENGEAFVYGVAMPTKDGLARVLRRCGAGPCGARHVLWTSLREEPVLYILGRPFVLRLFQDPLKNLEATGITRERVENMEKQLKQDVLDELERYNGRILLHEEELGGPKGFEIVPVWETCKPSDVLTPLEMYQQVIQQGYQVDYLRVPITDEQAPIPEVFDMLLTRLLARPSTTDAIFNCQMGRGRTTTGMVVTTLLEMIVGDGELLDEGWIESDEDNGLPMARPSVPMDSTDDSLEAIRLRYLAGEYKLILHLVSVLSHGKVAKRLTDRALDVCDHMQNLREAIYDYKLRAQAAEVGSKKWETIQEVGLNYLVRYFFLICFANYLLDEWCDQVGRGDDRSTSLAHMVNQEAQFDELEMRSKMGGEIRDARPMVNSKLERMSFRNWLGDRREITNLIAKGSISFD